jgi:RNA polymerase sigma-70 factor (ECF subfamily)
VFKTAMRLCRRELGKRARPRPEAPVPEDWVDRTTVRQDVAAAMADLSLRQRQSVVLRDWAGFETKDVARMLGMRESTVRVHLARGRERLRQTLHVEEETRT